MSRGVVKKIYKYSPWIKKVMEMTGSERVRLSLALSDLVRKIYQDGQHTRRTA